MYQGMGLGYADTLGSVVSVQPNHACSPCTYASISLRRVSKYCSADKVIVPLHGCINTRTSPCSNTPQRTSWIGLSWLNCHATHDISIMLANLNHLIVVKRATCSGLLEDGPVAFTLQLRISKALLLKDRRYCLVIIGCIHHTLIVYG
jgi:hypothetical protein